MGPTFQFFSTPSPFFSLLPISSPRRPSAPFPPSPSLPSPLPLRPHSPPCYLAVRRRRPAPSSLELRRPDSASAPFLYAPAPPRPALRRSHPLGAPTPLPPFSLRRELGRPRARRPGARPASASGSQGRPSSLPPSLRPPSIARRPWRGGGPRAAAAMAALRARACGHGARARPAGLPSPPSRAGPWWRQAAGERARAAGRLLLRHHPFPPSLSSLLPRRAAAAFRALLPQAPAAGFGAGELHAAAAWAGELRAATARGRASSAPPRPGRAGPAATAWRPGRAAAAWLPELAAAEPSLSSPDPARAAAGHGRAPRHPLASRPSSSSLHGVRPWQGSSRAEQRVP